MPTTGKLEVTIKINQLPVDVTTKSNGWKEFVLECGERPVTVALRPRMWNKLEEAQKSFPAWVAAISGTMGATHGKGFTLLEPNLQVFERKLKTADPAPPEGEAPPEGTKPA
jgi:hypothetical protein